VAGLVGDFGWGLAVLVAWVFSLPAGMVTGPQPAPQPEGQEGPQHSPPESPNPHPWVVRIPGLFAVALAIWFFVRFPAGCVPAGSVKGHICPSYALGDPWILRGERAAAALLGMTFLVVVFCRLAWQGRLPDKIGRDGAEWTATRSGRALARLEKIVSKQGEAIDRLTEFVRRQVE